MENRPAPRIIVYTCNWDAYSALEKAGYLHLPYPANVYPVRVNCLGRIHPGLVLQAFQWGAAGVLLLGCAPEACHYRFGSRLAQELFAETAALTHLLGIAPQRLRLQYLQPGDAQGFVSTLSDFAQAVSALPPWPASLPETRSLEQAPKSLEQAIRNSRAYYCLNCGKCTASCPVARRKPGFSPRAMVEMACSEPRGGTEWHSDRLHRFLDSLWDCLTCHRCSQVCPAAVSFSEFVREGRAWARAFGQEGHCSHGTAIQAWMRLMTEPALKQNRLGWLTPDLQVNGRAATIYFVGCLPYYEALFRKIGAQGLAIARSAVWVLNALGIEPTVLADERCCGHDLLWEGDLEGFRRLAALNAALLRATGAKRIVTTCPECAYTLGHEYPRHGFELGMEVLTMAQLLGQPTALAMLSKASGARTPVAQRVAYHDPCRLGRFLGIYDEPRQVIAALGLELVEMEHHHAKALCCGTVGWTNCGAASKSIQMERLQEARATGAQVLVTACAKCQIHLRCALNDVHLGQEPVVDIKDLTALVAEVWGKQ